MKTANATQVAGKHYTDLNIQVWDFIVANDIGYLAGNVIKYVVRDKNGIEDLLKAKHYIEKLIEVEQDKVLRRIRDEVNAEPAQDPGSNIHPAERGADFVGRRPVR